MIHHVFATTESAASKALGLRRSKGQQTLEMNSCIIIAATSESARNERDNMHSRICKVDLFAHYIKTPIFVQKLPLDKTFLVNQFEFLRQNSTILCLLDKWSNFQTIERLRDIVKKYCAKESFSGTFSFILGSLGSIMQQTPYFGCLKR